MKILKILLFCSIFIICYLSLYKLYIIRLCRKYEQQTKITMLSLDKIQWMFVLAVFIVSSYTYKSTLCGVAFGSAAYFLPKLYKNLSKNICKKKTLIDLLSVIESLSVQMSSNIPLKLALKNLPDVCRYTKFKDAMTDLYLEYQLTGFSLTKTLKKIKEKFPYTEILMFASAIEQQARGGNSESAYSNLLQVLKERNIEYIESATESKTAMLIIGVFLILINLLVIGCYPVIVEVSENLHTLMR